MPNSKSRKRRVKQREKDRTQRLMQEAERRKEEIRVKAKQDTTMKLTLKDLPDKIIQAKPQLLTLLVFDVGLKARLQQMEVITASLNDKMEPVSLTPMERTSLFLDDLMTGPVWSFLYFCRVMHEEGKLDILKELDVDIDYIDHQIEMVERSDCPPPRWKPRTVPSTQHRTSANQTSSAQKPHFFLQDNGEKQEIAADFLPGILEHCKVSESELMEASLFNLDEDITIDLTDLYCDIVTECKDDEKLKSISTRQLFAQLHQKRAPNTVIVEGEPGTGKSSSVRRYAYDWCRELLECHKKGPGSKCEGHMWQLIIYILAQSVNISQQNALRENLLCKESQKDKLLSMINEAGVLVINDGIDELNKKEEKESLRQYTIDCKRHGTPKVLVVSRTGLCPIEGKHFNRFVTIKGFSLLQGLDYVEKYFKFRQKPTEHPVLDYVKRHEKELEWVLTNPLRSHIFSELATSETLTLEDIATLSTVKLLKALEDYILKREEKHRGAAEAAPYSTTFYKVCLMQLLKQDQKMKEDSIVSTSPYMAFLDMHKERRDLRGNKNRYFLFVHQMFLEFFAVQGLVDCLKTNATHKKALLLFLCTDPNRRNLLLLTAGYISAYEPKLHQDLICIIQACVILQKERVACDVNELTEGLLQLPALIQETVSYDVLSQGLTPQQAATMDEAFTKIQGAFNQNAELMQSAGWFNNTYQHSGTYGTVISHLNVFIVDCIKQFTPSVQEQIYTQTTHRLLPSVRCNVMDDCGQYDEYIFPMAGVRWGLVRDEHGGGTGGITNTHVYVWSPSDLTSTLTQYCTHRQHPPPTPTYYINLHHAASMWGVPPGEVWTCEAWIPALRQILADNTDMITLFNHPSRTTPVDGLLAAVQHVLTPSHSLTRGLEVGNGHVSEEELVRFCKWTRTINLCVDLYNITVMLGADQDVDYVTRLKQHINELLRAGGRRAVFISQTYVTPDGNNVVPNIN